MIFSGCDGHLKKNALPQVIRHHGASRRREIHHHRLRLAAR
jgi:hypothetical protein